jgi:hypothetical protein
MVPVHGFAASRFALNAGGTPALPVTNFSFLPFGRPVDYDVDSKIDQQILSRGFASMDLEL